MKVIPLSELRARLSHYGRKCQKEKIVVTVAGRPAFQLVALDDDDEDIVSQLLEHNPRFRKLVEQRFKEKHTGIPVKEALQRIGR